MIYLSPEVRTSVNEDTFWDWMNRVFSQSSFEVPSTLNVDDIILRYSAMGFLPVAGKSVALCWEMYPQMQKLYHNNSLSEDAVKRVYEAARYCTYRVVATPKNAVWYEKFGTVEVIPIGVDTDFWRPYNNKAEFRKKYDIPQNAKVGVWIGTFHHMKGFARLVEYAQNNPEIYWIIVIGRQYRALSAFDNAKIFMDVPQSIIVELINAADFYLCTNRLSAYYMADWEAMSCNIPFVYDSEESPEFKVSLNPREEVMRRGWSRQSVQKQWTDFFEKHGVKYQ